ncbi:MAG TPA: CsbD family protein [Candidatus Aquilonibacter sp.]|nr:CsbD family protein [Candidatus Aquilonibacter sp.]
MKTLAWLAAGIGIGLVIYLIANSPGLESATGSDTLEGAARSAAGWGSRQRIAGAGADVLGHVKEGLGNLAGNPDLADEGAADRVAGNIKEGVGKFAQAAGQTLHDLNR